MKKWTINDYALLSFGRYKGFTYKEIGSVLGRSKTAMWMAGHKVNTFQKGDMKPVNNEGELLLAALRMDQRVRSGELKDMQQKWTAQLNRTRGIDTQFRVDEVKPVQPAGGVDIPLPQDTTPLISINIQVDSQRLEKLLGRVFGNL